MRRVLVDTGALVALVRESDGHHRRAVRFFGEFQPGELLTTAPVLTEAMHLLPARSSRGSPRQIVDFAPAQAVLANLEAFADAAAKRAPYPVPQDQKRIASFKLPERLELVSEFPTSPVGKILKRELRERIAAKLAGECRR